MTNTIAFHDAVKLLLEARRLANQTVRDASEMTKWRRSMDSFLAGREGDNPEDRYDSPARMEHRKFVQQLFFSKHGETRKPRHDR